MRKEPTPYRKYQLWSNKLQYSNIIFISIELTEKNISEFSFYDVEQPLEHLLMTNPARSKQMISFFFHSWGFHDESNNIWYYVKWSYFFSHSAFCFTFIGFENCWKIALSKWPTLDLFMNRQFQRVIWIVINLKVATVEKWINEKVIFQRL